MYSEQLERKKKQYLKNRKFLKQNPEFVSSYEERFIVRYTYDSTSIEGNSLTLEETGNLLLRNTTPANKNLREIYEQINHKKAFEYAVHQIRNGSDLNEKIILGIHKILMERILPGGTYRERQVYIQGSAHECPDPLRLPGLMKEFYEDLSEKKNICNMPESGVNAIELACWTHLRFVSLHPFMDGNGRTSRMIMNYQLMKHGYAPISIPVEMRNDYISALENFHTTGNDADFKEIVAGLEEKELDFLIGEERKFQSYPDWEAELE